MSEEKLEETKKIIRATLISSPERSLTVNELCYQYRRIEEENIPFGKFNFRNAHEFLRSIPDTVELLEPNNTNSNVIPVTNERTQHILKLVQEQKPSSKKHINHRPDLHRQHLQRRRPILNNDFKKDVYKFLQNYPTGICWDEFDGHIQRILANHYLSQYDSEEVLNSINEFAFCNNGKVFLNENQNRGRTSIICCEESIATVDRHEECDGYRFISHHLRENLCALISDSKYADGLPLTKLTRNYELKFGYPLRPKDHGFTDVMDLVANLKTIFYMKEKKDRVENGYLLFDARRFPLSTSNKEGNIPKNVIEELKKMLRQGPMYADDLSQEYRRTYQRQLQPEDFGFKNLDSFLRHLEDTCKDIVFRERLMELKSTSTDAVNTMRRPRDIFHEDPFPPEVCDGDFRLETDPELAESKERETFGIIFGEFQTPAKFYIIHINKVKLLESMMKDLNEFYNTHGEKYRMPLPLVPRNLLCACTYSKNSEWHRVRVLSSNLKHAKIFFFDYGTIEENVNIEKLRFLHKDFAKFPALCMQGRLSGIEPKDDSNYSDSVCQKFYEWFGNVQLEAEVVRVASNYLEIFLHTQTDDRRIAVHEVLLSHHLVNRKKPETSVSAINRGLSNFRLSNTSLSSLERLPENRIHNEEKVIKNKISPRNNIVRTNADNVSEEIFGVTSEEEHKMPDSLSSLRASPKPLLEIPLSQPQQLPQLPRSYPNEMYQAQIQTDTHFPCSLYGHCSPYSCYSDPSLMYPMCTTYCMSQYLSTPHYQYLNMAHFPSLSHPPPGIHLHPVWQNNLSQNYSSSLDGRPYATNSENSRPTCSSISSISHESAAPSYETCKSVPSELAQMNNNMVKKVLEKLISEEIKKAIHSPNCESLEKSEEPNANICISEDVKSLREKDAVENKLRENFQSSDSNIHEEDLVVFSNIAGSETSPPTILQNSVYASEFIPKTKPKIRTSLNDSEFPPNVSVSKLKRVSRNEKLDSIRSFVLQQVKNENSSLEK